MSEKLIFVVEHCENCHLHQWNTRHNEQQYKDNAIGGKSNRSFAIQANCSRFTLQFLICDMFCSENRYCGGDRTRQMRRCL